MHQRNENVERKVIGTWQSWKEINGENAELHLEEIKTLNTIFNLKGSYRFSSSRAVNTLRLSYKNQ
jgi:tRNA G10  N-methylase Trm11